MSSSQTDASVNNLDKESTNQWLVRGIEGLESSNSCNIYRMEIMIVRKAGRLAKTSDQKVGTSVAIVTRKSVRREPINSIAML